jgi:hypothetical protein
MQQETISRFDPAVCLGKHAFLRAIDGFLTSSVLPRSLRLQRRYLAGVLLMRDPVSYRRIHGSRHCGNIRITFGWPTSGSAIPVRACGCGLCTKHRAAWTSHPDGRFYLHIADKSRATQYRFGTKTADFHVCQTCGAIPIVTCTLGGIRYAVLNVNTFDDVDRSELVETTTDFEAKQ